MVGSPWDILDTNILYDGGWLRLRRERCRTSNGDIIDPYLILEFPEWVLALPITTDGKVIMLEHYRHAKRTVSWEFPTGLFQPGETPEVAARRELREETGYVGDSGEIIGRLSPNPALQNNWMHVVMIRNVRQTESTELEPGEDLIVHLVEFSEIRQMIADGRMFHALNIAAFCMAECRQAFK